ncbi:MAG: hypothetical protein JNK56_10790 [Myxococcales bacterium]|nr:hypothetical protein [Myxococcales bacterium]
MHAKDLEPLLAPLRSPAVAELLGEADFELDPDDHLIAHLGKAVPKASLIAFGQHGSGSLLALWRRDKQTALARCPVIWLDSEGDPIEALAPDFAAFLGLLPYGLGQLYDLIKQAQRMRDGDEADGEPDAIEVDVADLREGLVMVAEELDEWRAAGLPPVRDPLTVVEQAVALPFAAWWDGLPDA